MITLMPYTKKSFIFFVALVIGIFLSIFFSNTGCAPRGVSESAVFFIGLISISIVLLLFVERINTGFLDASLLFSISFLSASSIGLLRLSCLQPDYSGFFLFYTLSAMVCSLLGAIIGVKTSVKSMKGSRDYQLNGLENGMGGFGSWICLSLLFLAFSFYDFKASGIPLFKALTSMNKYSNTSEYLNYVHYFTITTPILGTLLFFRFRKLRVGLRFIALSMALLLICVGLLTLSRNIAVFMLLTFLYCKLLIGNGFKAGFLIKFLMITVGLLYLMSNFRYNGLDGFIRYSKIPETESIFLAYYNTYFALNWTQLFNYFEQGYGRSYGYLTLRPIFELTGLERLVKPLLPEHVALANGLGGTIKIAPFYLSWVRDFGIVGSLFMFCLFPIILSKLQHARFSSSYVSLVLSLDWCTGALWRRLATFLAVFGSGLF